MVYIKYSLVFLLCAASVALATLAQIKQQLSFVSSNSTNWGNLLNAFDTSGESEAVAIDILIAGQSLSESLALAAELTIANGVLSADDGTDLANIIMLCILDFLQFLDLLVEEKDLFIATPLGVTIQGFILSDLRNLNATSLAFADAYIGVSSSASFVTEAEQIRRELVSVLGAALAAYGD
ncbi:hypothetical protein HYPSUDRAFT_215912 [Hypholoma sublateritium FD-334 SS-4]|uniref:Uncharacterized protein n=1 Tax=Hypholoma sublateritium (strain FD-334 SS-4) TaxID=945553 RepID=A0A0D2MER0_HYPSF|nr:hypothetical protein HYPSUDRAFT_215912 [Hypholoma sublateritium FD-334 SS-4]